MDTKPLKAVIVIPDPKEFSIESSSAQQISDLFKPMLSKMIEYESEHNRIVAMEHSEEKVELAADLRKRMVKTRTGTKKLHQKLKADILARGRFLDAFKNTQLLSSTEMEASLQNIEKRDAILEQERIDKLHNERLALVQPFVEENAEIGFLGSMDDALWESFLFGLKAKAEHRAKEAIENERIQKARTLHQKRNLIIVGYHDFVTKEEKAIADWSVYSEEEFNGRIAELKKEKGAYLQKVAKQEAENKKLKMEQQQREEAEAKRIAEEKAKEEAEKSKGDKEKMEDIVKVLESIEGFEFESETFKHVYEGLIGHIFGKVIPSLKKYL